METPGVEARPRPPPHAHNSFQPRGRLPGCRPHRGGDRPARVDAKSRAVEARRGTSRYALQPQLSRRLVPGRRPRRRGGPAPRDDVEAVRVEARRRPPRHAQLPRHPRQMPTWLPAWRAEAVPYYEAALSGTESKLGPGHPHTLASRHNLATAHLVAGPAAEAVPLLEMTLKGYESKLVADHPHTLTCRSSLAYRLPASRPLGRRGGLVARQPGRTPEDRRRPTAPCWPPTSSIHRSQPAEAVEVVRGRGDAPRIPGDPHQGDP